MTTIAEFNAMVDELGKLKAQIAPLLHKEDELKARLVKNYQRTGRKDYSGAKYDAVVIEAARSHLDMDAVKSVLTPQFITEHTSATTVYSVKVTAKKL